MCLAIPARVVELLEGSTATIDLDGVRRSVSIALLDDVRVGDYVVVHVGFAIAKLDPERARETLALFASVGAVGSGVPPEERDR